MKIPETMTRVNDSDEARQSYRVLRMSGLSRLKRMAIFCLLGVFFAIENARAIDRMRVATGGYSPSIPPYATFAAPFYRQQDLEVESILMSSGTISGQALAAGEVKAIVTTGPVAMQANLSGGDMVIIAGLIHKFPYQIVARGEIKTAADLKGKRVGISRFGSSSDWLVRLGLAKLGVDADKDVTILQIGEQGARLTALQSNAIQATPLVPPLSTQAVRKLGMKELVDLAELDVTYPLQVVITTRSFLQTNRPLLKRFLKSFASGVHHYKTDAQAGINFQMKQFKLNREDAEIGYRYSAKVLDPTLSLPNQAAFDVALKEIALRVEKARTMTIDSLRVVDASLRNELAKEGVFEQGAK
jgi:NitT/TauT family transport system substrate-binding protein